MMSNLNVFTSTNKFLSDVFKDSVVPDSPGSGAWLPSLLYIVAVVANALLLLLLLLLLVDR